MQEQIKDNTAEFEEDPDDAELLKLLKQVESYLLSVPTQVGRKHETSDEHNRMLNAVGHGEDEAGDAID